MHMMGWLETFACVDQDLEPEERQSKGTLTGLDDIKDKMLSPLIPLFFPKCLVTNRYSGMYMQP